MALTNMRICFIADAGSIHVQRIVSYYVSRGDEILVLSSARQATEISGTRTIHLLDTSRPPESTSNRKARGGMSFVVQIKSLIPIWLIVSLRRALRGLQLFNKRKFCVAEILRFKADVIYCFRCFPEGILASRCGVRPVLLRTAGADISTLPKYPIYKQLIRNALQSADVVVTESFWERRLLHRLCGPDVQPKVALIGIDASVFKPPVSREGLREKYGLPLDSFVVVSNRYLEGNYNGWLVVQAVQSVLERCRNLVFLYVNPAKMGSRTRAKAEAIAASCPQIRFIDGRLPYSEMPNILGCGDVYVTFSSADGIPNSLLEAMACGLVPIAAELPQLREWIEDGKTGYLVPQTDKARLASIIHDLYVNRHVLADMSKRCVSKIREAASYEECSAQIRTRLFELAKITVNRGLSQL
jgi:glycosyltransferase involved in cell wall biosynthesis